MPEFLLFKTIISLKIKITRQLRSSTPSNFVIIQDGSSYSGKPEVNEKNYDLGKGDKQIEGCRGQCVLIKKRFVVYR